MVKHHNVAGGNPSKPQIFVRNLQGSGAVCIYDNHDVLGAETCLANGTESGEANDGKCSRYSGALHDCTIPLADDGMV